MEARLQQLEEASAPQPELAGFIDSSSVLTCISLTLR
jgi:hypothetical protein